MGNKDSKCPSIQDQENSNKCPKGTKPACIPKGRCVSQKKVENFVGGNNNLLPIIVLIILVFIVYKYYRRL